MTMTPAGPPLAKPLPRDDPPPYTAGPSTYSVPLGREATTMSKMTEACGPPPPPPTKMSNNPHGHDLNTGSQTSLKKDLDYLAAAGAIPEENKKDLEAEKSKDKKNKKKGTASVVSEEGESVVAAQQETEAEAKVETEVEGAEAPAEASEQTGEKDSAGND
ncbi:hypothetical protein PoB_006607000 [Plakobranchus ocellatus]|uniref:Uncharacterized protein n=1 Tax=Plakobranchus ocellatus TaxID=259542 RepID=A0AAV4D5Z2_9GAST|nr:hypothetical protein PoB_006607000 [Plakobranchus ocellatus]